MAEHAVITCLNGADHVTDHALITWLSCTDDVPHEAIIKELRATNHAISRQKSWTSAVTNHAAQLAIIKQLSRQESHGSAEYCQADEEAGITQLSWQ